jgi:hypothetical protein
MISAVPEPIQWAILVLSFGLTFFGLLALVSCCRSRAAARSRAQLESRLEALSRSEANTVELFIASLHGQDPWQVGDKVA